MKAQRNEAQRSAEETQRYAEVLTKILYEAPFFSANLYVPGFSSQC
jgi:hypothetical protein